MSAKKESETTLTQELLALLRECLDPQNPVLMMQYGQLAVRARMIVAEIGALRDSSKTKCSDLLQAVAGFDEAARSSASSISSRDRVRRLIEVLVGQDAYRAVAGVDLSAFTKAYLVHRSRDGFEDTVREFSCAIEEAEKLAATESIAEFSSDLFSQSIVPPPEIRKLMAETSLPLASKPRMPKKKRRGRSQEYDPEVARKVAEAWDSGRYRTYNDLARELGMTGKEVKLALGRHRKAQAKASK